jgi:hypothetical protein
MSIFRAKILSLTVLVALALPVLVNAQASNPMTAPGSTTTLGQQVTLPPLYESVVSSLSAIATSGAAALKTYRSGGRARAIRTALTTALLNAAAPVTTITLDKTDSNALLGDVALLCTPRQSYVGNSVSLSYVNTLVQNINTISALPAAPTDIGGALALLFSTSGYSIADHVNVDPATIAKMGTAAVTSCQADLSSYDASYYGTRIRPPGPAPAAVTPAAAAPGGVDTFAFLGPVGTLIDTFLSILQPILIDASKIVDQTRRQSAIMNALTNPTTQAKIATTGQLLASAVDDYATASRQSLVGSFVEQLVSIRETSIDLTSVSDCKNVAPSSRLPSGAPEAAFIACWSAAWSKLKTQVDNLTAIGDSYDLLADATTISAETKLGTILADFNEMNAGKLDASSSTNLAIFAADVTEFINFANAVAAAASQNNVSALKSATAAASK